MNDSEHPERVDKFENPERGRRARNIFIASCLLFGIWTLFVALLLYCLIREQTNQHWASFAIIATAISIGLLTVIKAMVSLFLANDSIFPYSGQPTPMLNKLYESLSLDSQTNLALLAVVVISVLMNEKIITSESGLPIISAIIGYTVAKNINKEQDKKEG